MLQNSTYCARGVGARLFGWYQRSDPRLLQRDDPFGVHHWVGGAVGVVRDANGGVPKWDKLLKCKCDIDAALQRRHNLGRGTLVVLDAVPESGTSTYMQRHAMLESFLPSDAAFGGETARPVPCGAVVLTPAQRDDSHADTLAFYQRHRAANRMLDCDFFEGVVMKRADSIYPVQFRSATEEFRRWCKHRFLTQPPALARAVSQAVKRALRANQGKFSQPLDRSPSASLLC